MLHLLFPIRVVLILFSVVFLINRVKRIPRGVVFSFLLSIYTFAFILSPYWNAPKSLELKIVSLFVLSLIIPVLAYYSSSTIKLDWESFGHPRAASSALLILTGLLYAINYIPLKADIPFRGDEDYHMSFILDMRERISSGLSYLLHPGVVLGLFLLIVLMVVFIFRRLKNIYPALLTIYLALTVASFLVVAKLSSGFSSNFADHFTLQVLRYPNLQKWLGFFLIYPSFYSDVALYRLVPFLSALFLCWFLYIKFREKISPVLSVIFSLLFLTIPLLFYYSSLLYLEMPAILLMTICVFNLDFICTVESNDLLKSPVWYSLLLIPFLKETTLLFLVLLLGARMVYQIGKRMFLAELKIWILILAPLMIYLFFRSVFAGFQGHEMQLYKLFSRAYYLVEIKSLWQQLGLFLILGITGLVLLATSRRWSLLVVLTLLIIGHAGLTIVDSKGIISYAGYSRWNLFLLPILLFAAYFALTLFKKPFQIVAALLLLASNIYFAPFRLDGTRLPNWGSPLVDTGEYTYPYEKAIQFLKQEGKTQNLLIAGLYYHYDGTRFYFPKYKFFPKTSEYFFGYEWSDQASEVNLLDKLFHDISIIPANPAILSADKILYHSVNNINLDKQAVYGGSYKIVKKISNSEHSIYIFAKGL